MESNKYDYIQPGKVKDFYKNATEEERKVLVRKYLDRKYMEEESEKDLAYANQVSEKLAKIEFYEKSVKDGEVPDSKKVFNSSFSDEESEKDYEMSTELRGFYQKRRDKISNKLFEWFEETFPDTTANFEKDVKSSYNKSVISLGEYLKSNEYHGRFDNPDIDLYLSDVFNNGIRKIPSLESFSKPEVDNKYLGEKLKDIQKGKRSIDKKVSLDNKQGFFYKPVKFVSDIVYGDLETRLNTQKEKIESFDVELTVVSNTLLEYKNLLMDGFDNLCNYWMKADSLIEDYSQKINDFKTERKNTSLLSWSFLKNLKKRKNLKNQIENYKDRVYSLDLKKGDIERSFLTYKTLFDKNREDTLFVNTLQNEKDYYNELLNGSGNIIFNLSNRQGIYSLGSLEGLNEFYNSVGN